MEGTVAVQLPADAFDALAERARARGTSVDDELTEAVERPLDEGRPNADLRPEALVAPNITDPNAGWLEMLRFSEADDAPRPYGPWPPVDSDLAKEMMVKDLYRDSFNREPDW